MFHCTSLQMFFNFNFSSFISNQSNINHFATFFPIRPSAENLLRIISNNISIRDIKYWFICFSNFWNLCLCFRSPWDISRAQWVLLPFQCTIRAESLNFIAEKPYTRWALKRLLAPFASLDHDLPARLLHFLNLQLHIPIHQIINTLFKV